MYPPALVNAILRGVVAQKKIDHGTQLDMPRMGTQQLSSFIGSLMSIDASVMCRHDGLGRPIGDWPEHWIDPVHEDDGGCDRFGSAPQNGIHLLKAELDALTWRDGMTVAKDDVSGADLVPGWVVAARAEEMEYFKKLGVYRIVPRSHQLQTGGKVIGTRWVDVNKGDFDNPNCRSIFVGREFNAGKDDSLYAATPPLEALRYVLSCAATWRDNGAT